MRSKVVFFLTFALSLLMMSSCEDSSMTKDIYDDWWPIHASGSQETEFFTAHWDGDLNNFGNIDVTFVDKTDPSLTYVQTKNYYALSFVKGRESFCYIDISDRTPQGSRYYKFQIKDKKIYFEVPSDSGRGSGTFDEGHDITFLDKDHVKIDNVKYERYSVYYEKNKSSNKTTELAPYDGRIPVVSYAE